MGRFAAPRLRTKLLAAALFALLAVILMPTAAMAAVPTEAGTYYAPVTLTDLGFTLGGGSHDMSSVLASENAQIIVADNGTATATVYFGEGDYKMNGRSMAKVHLVDSYYAQTADTEPTNITIGVSTTKAALGDAAYDDTATYVEDEDGMITGITFDLVKSDDVYANVYYLQAGIDGAGRAMSFPYTASSGDVFYPTITLDTDKVSAATSLSGATVYAPSLHYTGNALEPGVTVALGGETLEKDVDYTVAYENNTDAGQASATITGIGKYYGSATGNFDVVPVGDGGANWVATYGDTGTNSTDTVSLSTVESIYSVEVQEDGSLLAAGLFDAKSVATGTHANAKGDTEAAIVTFDAKGDQTSEILVSGSDKDYFAKAIKLSDGSIIAVGASRSNDGDFATASTNRYKSNTYYATICKIAGDGAKTVVGYGGTGKDYFRDVVATSDGGFLAVGCTESTDNDLEELKTTSDRDALVVKFKSDLTVDWAKVIGGSESVYKTFDDFTSVTAANDGSGYLVAGYEDTTDGSFAIEHEDGTASTMNKGERDGVIVKFSEDGTRQWMRTYGGTGADAFNSIAADVDDSGYVLAGYTTSTDGDFAANTAETCASTVTRVDAEGNVVFAAAFADGGEDTSPTGEKCAAVSVKTLDGGYVVAGNYVDKGGVFEDEVEGNKAVYLAYLTSGGTLQGISTYDGAGKDTARGVVLSGDDAFVYGHEMSSTFYGNTLRGKSDGFVISVAAEDLVAAPSETFTVPVCAIKTGMENTSENVSMLSNFVYDTAYVEKYGDDAYQVTIYLHPATVMGQSFTADQIDPIGYNTDSDSDTYELVDNDVFNAETGVRAITLTATNLSEALPVYMKMAWADLRFDTDQMAAGDAPEYNYVEEQAAAEEEAAAYTAAQSELDDAIATAAAVKQGAKTDSAYKSLQAAIATARAAASDASRSSATMAAATTALRGAVSAFAKSADKAYLAKGKTFTVAGVTYKVTNASKRYVAAIKISTSKSALALGTVKYAGSGACKAASYKVTAVGAGAVKSARKLAKVTLGADVAAVGAKAFAKAPKLKTVVVKGRKLTKKGVTNSLRGSKVTRVKVSVGNAKLNKAYAKKYAKIFTKANAGKKVAVK